MKTQLTKRLPAGRQEVNVSCCLNLPPPTTLSFSCSKYKVVGGPTCTVTYVRCRSISHVLIGEVK